jgi:HD-like signal output (HDOD) protein
MSGTSTSLEEWVRRLRDRDMPVFSRTVQALNEAMNGSRSGVLELSQIILEDPTLTAKILKLSNSPYYNPGRQKLATITRAIVLIGLQTVRDLALACSFIETVLSYSNKKQVQREIARSLHSAVQAKALAILANDPQPEEIFIAALLNNIGEVVFWCFDQGQGQEISRLIQEGRSSDQAEREALGFRLKQLGATLSKHWKLGELVEDVFETNHRSPRSELARLGCEVALACEHGWESDIFKTALNRAAERSGKPAETLANSIRTNCQNALKLIEAFGAAECLDFIPNGSPGKPEKAEPIIAVETSPIGESTSTPSSFLQILNDISALLAGDTTPSFPIVLELVVEGIFRSLEMDRVLLLLTDPTRKQLKESIALGWPSVKTRFPMQFPLICTPPTIVSHALEKDEALWLQPSLSSPHSELFTPLVANQLGRHECFISPLGINRNAIGIIYADRSHSKKPITTLTFDAFRQLAMQTNIALKLCKKLSF